jgi:bifunctional UDP-N-acetylglucosamine pyrophosphorylase/glucosamine-1-phosphate N-acetyltransferase
MGEFAAVVLAAGLGTRMKSQLPKGMHRVCGKPMVGHVVSALESAGCSQVVVVVGQEADEIRDYLGDRVQYAVQVERLGTGHAVLAARDLLSGFEGITVVCYGDNPALTAVTIRGLVCCHQSSQCVATAAVARLQDPSGFGRVIRTESGEFDRVVEEKDASPEQRQIVEVNAGLYAFDNSKLFQALERLDRSNAQGEYLLPDALLILKSEGSPVRCFELDDPADMAAVNTRKQLAEVDRILRDRVRERLMASGVTLVDPDKTYIDSDVEIGADTIIYPFTSIEGSTRIGEGCIIGMGCRIADTTIGDRTRIDQSTIVGSMIGSDVTVGPFAYIRPESRIEDGVKIGDFTEIKKSRIGKRSKVPHLSYVGDADIGEGVNIGAGTITCNYDGRVKHKTTVLDGAFVGSNTNLVAPVKIGAGAYVAAGSTITSDVPDEALAIGRSRQVIKERWARKRAEQQSQELPNPPA